MQAQYLELVLGVAGVELLPCAVSHDGVCGHVDARTGAAHAGLPASLFALHPAVRVERGGVLPEVPHVARTVLGIPVGRSLAEVPALIEPVVDHGGPDPGDDPRATGH